MNTDIGKTAIFIFGVAVYLFVFVITIYNILSGSMAFWYDPARDLLLAINNLQKPTLIGPPAGIPGIFYGPYWIWMLSIGLLVSKDPRVVTVVVLFLPYFILLPYLFFNFGKKWGITTAVIMESLFLLNFSVYTKQLWNPHPAPLLFIALVYLLAVANFTSTKIKNLVLILVTGFLGGLLVNLHISFGVGMIGGLMVFFIIEGIRSVRGKQRGQLQTILPKYIVSVLVFVFGAAVAYVPFFSFEFRHGFNQVQSAITAITSSESVVGVKGLTDAQILTEFAKSFYRLTGFTTVLAGIAALLLLVNIFYIVQKKQKIRFSIFDFRIITLAFASFLGVLVVYITSKNPVWNYHFIGVEMIILLLVGIAVSKLSLVRWFFLAWVVVLFLLRIPPTIIEFQKQDNIDGTLVAKQEIVESVIKDSGGKEYTVVAYNPAIYTYDYDYLFYWKGNKQLIKTIADSGSAIPAYLIVPQENTPKVQDYINAQTRGLNYTKLKEWKMNNTRIVKLHINHD